MPRRVLSDFVTFVGTTQWHKIIVFIGIVSLSIGLGVGLSVGMTNAQRAADLDAERRQNIFTEWQMVVTSHFARAGSLAASVAAFVSSSVTEPMNFSAPSADRVKVINNNAFNRMCSDLFGQIPGVLALQLQSGGVISQSYPPGSAPIGLSVIDNPVHTPVYNRLIATGEPVTVGPEVIAQGGIGVFTRYPVFVSSNKTRDTFWGTGNVVMRLKDVLTVLNISTLVSEHRMDYVCWYLRLNTGARAVVTSSTGANEALIMQEGTHMELPIAEDGKSSFLSIYPQGGIVTNKMSTSLIVGIVVGVIAIAGLVMLVMYMAHFVAFCRRHRHAPFFFSSVFSISGEVGSSSKVTKKGNESKRGDVVAMQKGAVANHEGNVVYMAAVALRGAQSMLEHTPLEANEMFTIFRRKVKEAAEAHECYVVNDIGDRCVYVVSSDPAQLLKFSKQVVTRIVMYPEQIYQSTVAGGRKAQASAAAAVLTVRSPSPSGVHLKGGAAAKHDDENEGSLSDSLTSASSRRPRSISRSKVLSGGGKQHLRSPINRDSSGAEDTSNRKVGSKRSRVRGGVEDVLSSSNGVSFSSPSSLASQQPCYACVGLHCGPYLPLASLLQHSSSSSSSRISDSQSVVSFYDSSTDRYYYGGGLVMGKLGAAVDGTVAGEIAWTCAFKEAVEMGYSLDSSEDEEEQKEKDVKAAVEMSDRVVSSRANNNDNNNTAETTSLEANPNNILEVFASEALSCHTVTEKGDRVSLYISSWWMGLGEGIDDRSAEDPPIAMVILNDAYTRRMTAMATASQRGGGGGSRGRKGPRDGHDAPNKGGGGAGPDVSLSGGKRSQTNSSSGSKGSDITQVTRLATVLHIAYEITNWSVVGTNTNNKTAVEAAEEDTAESNAEDFNNKSTVSFHQTNANLFMVASGTNAAQCDARAVLDIVRRAVAAERGVVVSAHDGHIVAAFNLLTAGGHHQLRAANVVHRLRGNGGDRSRGKGGRSEGLPPNVHFACSIHFGRVTALIAEGLVVCGGASVSVGQALLQRAAEIEGLWLLSQRGGGGGVPSDDREVEDAYNRIVALGTHSSLPPFNCLVGKSFSLSASLRFAAPAFAAADVGAANLMQDRVDLVLPFKQRDDVHSPPSGGAFADLHIGTVAKEEHEGAVVRSGGAMGGLLGLGAAMRATPHRAVRGLCLMFCASELNTSFECEAIDVVAPSQMGSFGGYGSSLLSPAEATKINSNPADNTNINVNQPNKPLSPSAAAGRVLYRLGSPKTDGDGTSKGNGGAGKGRIADDEWMYQLKEEEALDRYARANAIFVLIADGEVAEAKRRWQIVREHQQQQQLKTRRRKTTSFAAATAAGGSDAEKTPHDNGRGTHTSRLPTVLPGGAHQQSHYSSPSSPFPLLNTTPTSTTGGKMNSTYDVTSDVPAVSKEKGEDTAAIVLSPLAETALKRLLGA